MNDAELRVIRNIISDLLNNLHYESEDTVTVESECGTYLCRTIKNISSKVYNLSNSEIKLMKKFVKSV